MMSERREWEPVPIEEAIDRIASAGLLTERQAEAYVFRDIELTPRQATADHMEISVNTLDKRLGEARRKVENAEETLETINDIRHRSMPDECTDCGKALSDRWSADDDGKAICLDCAGLEG